MDRNAIFEKAYQQVKKQYPKANRGWQRQQATVLMYEEINNLAKTTGHPPAAPKKPAVAKKPVAKKELVKTNDDGSKK